MSDSVKKITLPLSEDALDSLTAGDRILLSGEIYTLRDAGHKRLTLSIKAVSYTHLDVYKRQRLRRFSFLPAAASARISA